LHVKESKRFGQVIHMSSL